MSMFNVKNNKKIITEGRKTLDVKHKEILKEINNKKKRSVMLKRELTKLENNLSNIESRSRSVLDDNDINRRFDLKEKIRDLRRQIRDIDDNKELNNYFVNTSEILYDYYDNLNNSNGSNQMMLNSTFNTSTDKPKKIIDYFMMTMDAKKDTSGDNETKIRHTTTNRVDLLESYMNTVDPDTLKPIKIENIDYCPHCQEECYQDQAEGLLVCQKCGYMEAILIDSDKPSYKDPPPEISYYAYKRINHFNEILAQFQAKETTEIPQDVFDKLLLEIKKERIENMALLTNKKIKDYLKKLRLNKHYEHIPYIINRLNGLPPPYLNPEIEEKLRNMFRDIQGPFAEVRPKNRKNFLSYFYVAHKFVELLGLEQYKSCFPLLKSRDKLYDHDKIWKGICERLNWEFIPSI